MNTVTQAYTHTDTQNTRTQRHTATNVKHMDNVYNVTVHTQTQTGTRVHTDARAYTFRNEVYSLSAVFHIVR